MSVISGSIPSLVDYLYGGSSQSSTGIPAMGSSGTANTTGGLANYLNQADGDTVSLSTSAQNLIAQKGAADGGAAAKDEAKNFFLEFFDAKGVDVTKISKDVLALLEGVGDMIEGMGAVSHASDIDTMTNNYNKGARQSFTLQGTNERLSFTVEYKNGKPESLAVLQVQGATATRAVIHLTDDTLSVKNTQKQYNQFGSNTATNEADELLMKLYA